MTRTAAVQRSSVVKALLDSEEPSIRWKVRTQVLGVGYPAGDEALEPLAERVLAT